MIDETLRNFYALHSCITVDFKSYMKEKLENYSLLFCVLADAQDLEKKGNIHDLVMEISKDSLNTKRKVTGDRLYSTIDTAEEVYQKKATYVRKIMPNRKSPPFVWKTSKGQEVLSLEFMWKNISSVFYYVPLNNVLLVSTLHG